MENKPELLGEATELNPEMETPQSILNTYHPVSRDHKLKTDLWRDSTVLFAMEEYANYAKAKERQRIIGEIHGIIEMYWPNKLHIMKAIKDLSTKQ